MSSISQMYRDSARLKKAEPVTMPSMTEDAHIMSLEQIARDYTRGITHFGMTRNPQYDSGDDLDAPDQFEDISDVFPTKEEFHLFKKEEPETEIKPTDNPSDSEGA